MSTDFTALHDLLTPDLETQLNEDGATVTIPGTPGGVEWDADFGYLNELARDLAHDAIDSAAFFQGKRNGVSW